MATNTPIVMGGTILPYDLDNNGHPLIRIVFLDHNGFRIGSTASPAMMTNVGNNGLLPTTSGVLATGPISIPASAQYNSPSLTTAGFRNATLVPSTATGGVTPSARQTVQGILAYIHNSGSAPPPGMSFQNAAIGFLEPINDQIWGTWTNPSTSTAVTLGDILFSMT